MDAERSGAAVVPKDAWKAGHLVGDRYAVGRFLSLGPLGQWYAGQDRQDSAGDGRVMLLRTVGFEVGSGVEAALAGAQAATFPAGVLGVRATFRERRGLVVVLDFVDAPSLEDYVGEYGPLAEDLALETFKRLAEVLATAHVQGLVHGWLSASELLLMHDGHGLRPVVRGMGLWPLYGAANAKHAEALLQVPGRGEVLRPVDDVYAFAATMVTAFYGAKASPSWFLQQDGLSGIQADLQAALRQALEERPERRFQNMQALANLLTAMARVPEAAKSLERPDPGTVVAGQYLVQRLLGEGGMARVYLAQDTLLGTQVGLKLLNATSAADAEVVERFLTEASIQARLVHPEPHPHIVSVLRVLHKDPVGFVMEYVSGPTLEEMLQRETLSECAVADLFAQVCDGLAHAHGRRIVHRDIKLSNILVGRDASGDAVAKLMDFGISKQMDQPKTRTNLVLGTLGYLAPELFISAKDASAASDIYAVGCCLYEAFVGDLPFSASSGLRSLAFRVYNEAPTRPTALGAKVSAEMEALILACLAKKPEARPESAAWLGARLRHLARGTDDPELLTMLGAAGGGKTKAQRRATPELGRASQVTAMAVRPGRRGGVVAVLAVVAVLLAVAVVVYLLAFHARPGEVAAKKAEAPEVAVVDEPADASRGAVPAEVGHTSLTASVVFGADELLAQARAEAERGDRRAALRLYREATEKLDRDGGEAQVMAAAYEEMADLALAAAEVAGEQPAEAAAEAEEGRGVFLAMASEAYGRAAEVRGDFALFMKKAALDQERGDAQGALAALNQAREVAEDEASRSQAASVIARLEGAYAAGGESAEEARASRQEDAGREWVEVWLESVPENAAVLQGGRRIGRTPLIKRVPRTDASLRFTLRLSGYYDEVVELSGDSGGRREVQLALRPRRIR